MNLSIVSCLKGLLNNQSLSTSIYGFLAYPDIHISVELVAVQAGDEVVVVPH